MSHESPWSTRFHRALFELDRQQAEQLRTTACGACDDVLHVADYPRKPRGVPHQAGEAFFDRRFSFCCAQCRRRATPPSVRFLHGRVYVAVAVVLAMVLWQGAGARRARALRHLADLDIDRRTLARWRAWWCEAFPKSALWTELRARLDRPCDTNALPWSLLVRIDAEDDEQRLVRLLEMLRPLSHSPRMWRRLARAT